MGNLTVATIFIVAANVLIYMVGFSMASVGGGVTCNTNSGGIISDTLLMQNNLTVLSNDISTQLPSAQSSPVSSSGTSITFTDIFNNIVTWFKDKTGIGYVYDVVAAPYNILKCMQLPSPFVAAIGTLWYVVSFLILLAFMWGRD